MCRKWKKTAALGLAVLIGGMMPMNTMLAAEDNTEAVQEIERDSLSDADVVCDDEVISGETGSVGDEENAGDEVNTGDENTDDEVNADDENTGDEVNADDGNSVDEVDIDDVIADEEADTVNEQNAGIEVMSESEETEASGEDGSESTDAPVISITLNGESCKVDGLGGSISYQYTNVSNSKLGFSASLNGTPIIFSYYLDENPGDKAKDDIKWINDCSSMQWELSNNKAYVVYVKAEANEQTVYARSGGIVVDTIAPKIVGVEDGKTYQAGTTFTVTEANLSEVLINEQKVEPVEGGKYKVATQENSTSCVIKAIDKAGNSATCSITVSGSEKPDTGNVISESKVYALKAGVKYHLAAGNWKVDGDKSVYQGNSDFYVKEDGEYQFKK